MPRLRSREHRDVAPLKRSSASPAGEQPLTVAVCRRHTVAAYGHEKVVAAEAPRGEQPDGAKPEDEAEG